MKLFIVFVLFIIAALYVSLTYDGNVQAQRDSRFDRIAGWATPR